MNAKILLVALGFLIVALVSGAFLLLFVYNGFYYLTTGDVEYRTGAICTFVVLVVVNTFYLAGRTMGYRKSSGSWDFLNR